MTWLGVALVALALPVQSGQGDLAVPVSGEASFRPETARWGLAGVETEPGSAGFASLDESVVLFVSRRARFEVGGGGPVYFAGGMQLLTEVTLSDDQVAEHMRSGVCLGVLSVEPPHVVGVVQLAAGVYHLAAAPVVEALPEGTRIVLEFARDGQPAQATLSQLECRLPAGAGIDALHVLLPSFMTLVRKSQEGFVDPPMDDRPVAREGPRRTQRRHVLALADGLAALTDSQPPYGFRIPDRLDAPELVGTVKPGLFGWLSGRPVQADPYDPTSDWDYNQHAADRRHGIGN